MKCPKCKAEIDHVLVFSKCLQHGELRDNKIIDYGGIEEVFETLSIECPICCQNLKGHVKEEL